eukprot:TRINITY_DN8092_c0_g1_i5.p1 TRINITY_DN8092_c0_g1~~TRINITY_DN8092_c0_g1_i5.p1  ORF type:complete len:488 (+),score=61.46 TRINITY_DN8092_c0_g1_i5:73-1536(+)
MALTTHESRYPPMGNTFLIAEAYFPEQSNETVVGGRGSAGKRSHSVPCGFIPCHLQDAFACQRTLERNKRSADAAVGIDSDRVEDKDEDIEASACAWPDTDDEDGSVGFCAHLRGMHDEANHVRTRAGAIESPSEMHTKPASCSFVELCNLIPVPQAFVTDTVITSPAPLPLRNMPVLLGAARQMQTPLLDKHQSVSREHRAMSTTPTHVTMMSPTSSPLATTPPVADSERSHAMVHTLPRQVTSRDHRVPLGALLARNRAQEQEASERAPPESESRVAVRQDSKLIPSRHESNGGAHIPSEAEFFVRSRQASKYAPCRRESKVGAYSPTQSESRVAIRKESKHSSSASSCDFEFSTVMIRNLPPTMTQANLLEQLDQTGFLNSYDFCYVPVTFENGQTKGFGFVNFVSSVIASEFLRAWQGRSYDDHKLNLSVAEIQGTEANVSKWNCSRLQRIRNPQFRPFVRVESGDSTPALELRDLRSRHATM